MCEPMNYLSVLFLFDIIHARINVANSLENTLKSMNSQYVVKVNDVTCSQ